MSRLPCVVVALVAGLAAGAANAADPPKPNPKAAVSDLAEADADFAYQGEYFGCIETPRLGCERAGLQVVALGDGRFQAVQFRGGLPGAGWNRVHHYALAGERDGNELTLTASTGLTIVVDGRTATIRNIAGQLVGKLEKTHRSSPTLGAPPPTGATVLFDGSSADQFAGGRVTPDGLLIAGPGTKQSYGDFRLHLEFRLPYMPYARGQGRANSGVYIQERYEVQILDSFGLEGAFNECGSLYRQRAPAVNACLPPLAWQTYDIDFTAARFDSAGKKVQNARITVRHNGITVHDNQEITGKTGSGRAEGADERPIKLQDHGNPVHFRNIWIETPTAAPQKLAVQRGGEQDPRTDRGRNSPWSHEGARASS
jgi:hypothetical protein